MKRNVSAFTFIELMVSIIIWISIMFLAYVPYNHYQNKAKLKLSSRIISQSFYEAKNMAVSGLKDDKNNRSVGLYLENISGNNTYLTFLSYPHDIEDIYITNEEGVDTKIVKTKSIEENIKINYLNGYDNLLFFFDSITGDLDVYTFDGTNKTLLTDTELSIMFSYKNSTSQTLQREITYFTETNIVDYN